MPLNSSGPLSFGGSTVGQSINLELGVSATATASINATNFRTLAGVASGQISVSNFYGKSNFSGWFTSFGVSTAETQMRGLDTNSSGKVYFLSSSNVAGSNIPIIQVSTVGAITYQRNGFFVSGIAGYNLVTVDSSSNYYMLGKDGTNRPQVVKYNSSDTLQWNVYWTETSLTSGSVMNSKMAVDTSGNVFVAFMGLLPVCCGVNFYPVIRKLNSSGVLVAGIGFSIRPGDGADLPYGLGTDSSGNVYLVSAALSGCGVIGTTFIAKCNNSLVYQSKVNYSASGAGFSPNGFVFDTTNSVGYVAGTIASLGSGYILKINTSLSAVWCYRTSDTGYWTDIDVDSSGNVYAVSVFTVAGTGIRAVKIIKLDSGGSLQWARYLRPSTLNVDTSGTSISISGSTMTVGAKISGGTNAQNRAFVFQLPTSGAGTGTTFTNNSVSWTYTSYTETLTSVSLTNYTNGANTSFSTSAQVSVTPSITTSAYTAVTTTL
jgi:hypothetical protein